MKWFIAISLMWRQAQAAPAPAPGPGKHFLIETEDEDKEATGYKGNVSLWWHDDMMTLWQEAFQTIDRMVQYTYI